MAEGDVLDGAVAPAENTRLFGHKAAESYLAEAYRSGKNHHAILIEGPEGIGKASLAFRFANHILHHRVAAEAPLTLADPDPASPVTRQIISGASHDLLHLRRPVDAKTGKVKSAITVDEVRRAGHFFAQTSGTGNWRIVIVDAADDLNRNAANAILKILEEPPRNALFMLLSHAPGRLLPTIRSRCLPLRLRPLATDDLMAALANLGISVPADERDEIAMLSAGSVGQALKLINYGGRDIIAGYHEALTGGDGAARLMTHRLADTLSKRENEAIADFFLSYLEEDLQAKAREAAFEGKLERAEAIARFSVDATAEIRQARAFNLDQKQLMIDLVGAIRDLG
ncbi:DNA polymerase III subunit delta' [Martelella sp. HB161492]|uniref:DNA polymerase III subunit delta' n=1 Tax=Martelella sp. HB161492 TaxID=2720726 RepID=UPI001591CFC5|nr:DNA polymerase III subunit delta' [Martelella sp. HB161492]